jgi:protein-S-isoprenylcysteine O-methyltransferase Ste14
MLLGERMSTNGGFLFRWRSFVPLIFLPLMLLTFPATEPVERFLGEIGEEVFEGFCLLLVVGGLLVRALTVGFVPGGTSGRNTRRQVAKVLNTSGLYSLTRNPLYVGNCLTYLGIVLLTQNLLLALTFALFLVIYYERIIMAEEAFLLKTFGQDYADWAVNVPAFLPRTTGWTRPDMRFSIRSVLRREYPSWFAALILLSVVELSETVLGTERGEGFDREWLALLAVGAVVYLALHILRRRTRVLDVAGR